MNIQTIILIVTGIVGVVTYLHNRSRDRKQKKLDLQAQYMINTYNRLNHLRIEQQNISGEELVGLVAQCLADTELFGTLEQIELARRLGEELANKAGKETSIENISPLINNIRDSLRAYVGMPRSNKDTCYICKPSQGSS